MHVSVIMDRFSGDRVAARTGRDLPEAAYEALRQVAFDERRKIHDLLIEGVELALKKHGWLWNDPATPGIKVVRAGTLDNMGWAEPIRNIWTDSKAASVKIDPELVNFPKQALDRTPLFDGWTQRSTPDIRIVSGKTPSQRSASRPQ